MKLRDVVLMRNRVTHGYTSIDKELFVNALKNDIPFFKEYIEQNVIKDVLYDPYQLYEKEYDDVVSENIKSNNIEDDFEDRSI